jgi:hypothetical protein
MTQLASFVDVGHETVPVREMVESLLIDRELDCSGKLAREE